MDEARGEALYGAGSIVKWSNTNKEDVQLKNNLVPYFKTFIARLQLLDDPKKAGVKDELMAAKYFAMRSIILSFNGKQISDFSTKESILIQNGMGAIGKEANKEEIENLLKEITE